MVMEWTEDLAIGVERLDSQHKELFNKINHLVAAIKEAKCKYIIDGTIKFLEDYATIHFAEEERCMEESGYEECQKHKEHHASFLVALLELRKEAALPRKADSSYDLCVATNQVVVDWIAAHIMQYDRRFGEFLKTARQEAC
jgi:hemerythrin